MKTSEIQRELHCSPSAPGKAWKASHTMSNDKYQRSYHFYMAKQIDAPEEIGSQHGL